MNRYGWLAAVTVGVGAVVATQALAPGVGPVLGGGPTPVPQSEPEPTAPTPTPQSTASSGGNGTAAGLGPGWSFGIDSIEACGNTCRDVTATLENTGDTARENVTVITEVYAEGDLLWEGTNRIGRLEPGEANTATRRVDVGFDGGVAIQSNDGYVTVRTVVSYDGGRTVFEDRKQVA
jgi:hypothetical protein